MAQNKKPIAKPSNSKIKDKKPPVYTPQKKEASTLFSSVDKWLTKNSKALLILIFGLSILFSFLLFHARMDIGGDDSSYILRAYDFIHKGIFPSFQGPLYPIFLSIFISFLGIKVVFLKFLSLIFCFISMLFLYKAFKDRVPALVLYSALLLTAINSSILVFGSLTYSEVFFMSLQGVFFYYFFKLLDTVKDDKNFSLKLSRKNWLLVGLFMFLMIAAKSVGITALGGLVLYFLFRKQYRYIIYLLGAFLVFYIPSTLIQKVIWHVSDQFGDQLKWFMQKNPYNAGDGNENFNGFVIRFFQNCDLYLSKRFFQIIGLRSSDSTETYTSLTFTFVLLFFFSIYRVIKSKNRYLLATAMYLLSVTAMTFVIIQTQWDQPRLIMVFVPLYLMLFIYAIYDLLKKAPWGLQFIGVFLVLIIVGCEFSDTFKKTKENLPVLSKNLHGDIYYGFTPDWVNYLKMSQWCENLPKDSLVACRKGPMSSVYANGRGFFNIAKTDNINTENADSVISWFKRNNVRYILLAKLRLNPTNPDGGYINTLDRVVYPIAKKYPQKLRLIHQEGTSEEAQLYEIQY